MDGYNEIDVTNNVCEQPACCGQARQQCIICCVHPLEKQVSYPKCCCYVCRQTMSWTWLVIMQLFRKFQMRVCALQTGGCSLLHVLAESRSTTRVPQGMPSRQKALPPKKVIPIRVKYDHKRTSKAFICLVASMLSLCAVWCSYT